MLMCLLCHIYANNYVFPMQQIRKDRNNFVTLYKFWPPKGFIRQINNPVGLYRSLIIISLKKK